MASTTMITISTTFLVATLLVACSSAAPIKATKVHLVEKRETNDIERKSVLKEGLYFGSKIAVSCHMHTF